MALEGIERIEGVYLESSSTIESSKSVGKRARVRQDLDCISQKNDAFRRLIITAVVVPKLLNNR